MRRHFNSCEQSVADLRALAQPRGVELRCLASDESVVRAIPGSANRMGQFVTDAIRTVHPDQPCRRVELRADTASILLKIQEQNNGEHLPYVFERFRRVTPRVPAATGGSGSDFRSASNHRAYDGVSTSKC